MSHARHIALGRPRRPPAWKVMLADLLALILSFLVLLFSMRQINYDNWRDVLSAFASQPGMADDRLTDRNSKASLEDGGRPLSYLETLLKQKLTEDPDLAMARLRLADDSLILELPGKLLFPTASARPFPAAKAVAERLGEMLSSVANGIDIIGRADPRPLRNSPLGSNWGLSLARAASLAAMLRAAGYPYPLRIIGAGSGAFYTENLDLPMKQRLELARRVDIVIRTRDAMGG